ncbi:MAG: neutral/alkaline non-lysosomal ceramidase N-terminal domain-containing protein [Kiritimatiellae bacterium]|nr:neutral/alkaline non-lysosomal ceramidase N-terminal domain-containing protein [Kiritimatiellia bacterium]
MKRIGVIAASITMFFGVFVSSADTFRAGVAKGNITPNLGAMIIGGFRPYPATHVHDDLWVKCLVLDNGQTRMAFVVCDVLGISRAVSDEARQRVQQESGMPGANILVSAVHTHSAASAIGNRFSLKPELDDYQEFMVCRIVDTVRCAINNLEPARIGWATASVPQHVFCRRWFMKPGTMTMNPFGSTNDLVKMNPPPGSPNLERPAGPTDPQVCLIAVKSLEGRPIGLLANYSLHYVGGVRGADISADYFGMFDDRMRQLLDADHRTPQFVAMMSNGTSGNINNIDFTKKPEKREPYARMREVADDVAQAVHVAYQTIQWHDSVPLGVSFEEINLQLRHPSSEQLERARGVLAKLPPNAKPSSLEEIYADRILMMPASPQRESFPLQTFRIGEVGIATFPVEVFSEIGLELKARSPFKPTFVVSLAHGYFGYLPTVEQHKLGGYETWLSTSRLETEAAPKMIEQLLGMLTRFKSE